MSALLWGGAFALRFETALVLAVVLFALAMAQTGFATSRALRGVDGWARVVYEYLLALHLALGMLAVWVVLRADSPVAGCAEPGGLGAFGFLVPNLVVLAWGLVLCVHGRRPAMLPEMACVASATPLVAWLLGPWWAWAVVLDAAVMTARVVAHGLAGMREQAGRPSGASVVRAVTELPEGVLCFRADGRVLVMNDVMRDCLTALGLSTDLADARGLWEALGRAAQAAGGAGAVLPEGVRLETGGHIRMFMLDEVVLGGMPCQRVIAVDVTDRERLVIQTEEANRRLEETGERLRASMDGVAEVARNEALAAMRSKVHDVIGQRLSILHRYLEDGTDPVSFGQVKALLASIADDLRSGSDTQPDAATELAAVVDAFALIDVEVRLRGALPADSACALAFARTVREAATNAVRHAQASVVEVVFAQVGDVETCTVRNDGAPCAAPPREGGGLAGMRSAAAALGGVLEVDPGPPFTVCMRVPRAQTVGEGRTEEGEPR